MVADERLQVGATADAQRGEIGVRGAVQIVQRSVAVQVERGEQVVVAVEGPERGELLDARHVADALVGHVE